MGRKEGNFFNNLTVMVGKDMYKVVKATCPGSQKLRLKVFDTSMIKFLRLESPHKNRSTLNRFQWFAADMLVSFKSQIEKYNQYLMQKDIIGYSSALETWPTLERQDQVILSIWLIKDARLRLALVLEYYLELDPKIIDHVMGWGKHHGDFLKRAKSDFCRCYRFVQEHTKDSEMPRYLLTALLDEGLNVPSQKELALIQTDLVYCQSLVQSNV